MTGCLLVSLSLSLSIYIYIYIRHLATTCCESPVTNHSRRSENSDFSRFSDQFKFFGVFCEKKKTKKTTTIGQKASERNQANRTQLLYHNREVNLVMFSISISIYLLSRSVSISERASTTTTTNISGRAPFAAISSAPRTRALPAVGRTCPQGRAEPCHVSVLHFSASSPRRVVLSSGRRRRS